MTICNAILLSLLFTICAASSQKFVPSQAVAQFVLKLADWTVTSSLKKEADTDSYPDYCTGHTRYFPILINAF